MIEYLCVLDELSLMSYKNDMSSGIYTTAQIMFSSFNVPLIILAHHLAPSDCDRHLSIRTSILAISLPVGSPHTG